LPVGPSTRLRDAAGRPRKLATVDQLSRGTDQRDQAQRQKYLMQPLDELEVDSGRVLARARSQTMEE